MAKQTSKTKKILMAVSLSLAMILLGGVAGGLLQRHFRWGEEKLETSETNPPSGGGGSVLEHVGGNNMKLHLMQLASSEFDAYGVSAAAETAYTLTATVLPADTTNKKVDWSIAFKNASSTWASGKTVTDYVTVTPSADGALTAVVACLQPFGEQIKVTVTSQDNAEAKAEVSVDYVKRLTGAGLSIGGNNTVVCSESGTSYNVTLVEEYTAGTLASVTEIETLEIGLATSVVTAIRNAAPILQYAVFQSVDLTETKQFTSSQAFLNSLFKGTRLTSAGEIVAPSTMTRNLYNNALKTACQDMGTAHARITVNYRNYYGNTTYKNDTFVLQVKLDLSALATRAESITTSESGLIF